MDNALSIPPSAGLFLPHPNGQNISTESWFLLGRSTYWLELQRTIDSEEGETQNFASWIKVRSTERWDRYGVE